MPSGPVIFCLCFKEKPSEGGRSSATRVDAAAGHDQASAAGSIRWLRLAFKSAAQRNRSHSSHGGGRKQQPRPATYPMLCRPFDNRPTLKESGRFDAYGPGDAAHSRTVRTAICFMVPRNEEMIHRIRRSHVGSIQDLPMTLYQSSCEKFRDEGSVPGFPGVIAQRRVHEFEGRLFTFDLTKKTRGRYKPPSGDLICAVERAWACKRFRWRAGFKTVRSG